MTTGELRCSNKSTVSPPMFVAVKGGAIASISGANVFSSVMTPEYEARCGNPLWITNAKAITKQSEAARSRDARFTAGNSFTRKIVRMAVLYQVKERLTIATTS